MRGLISPLRMEVEMDTISFLIELVTLVITWMAYRRDAKARA